MPRAYIKIEYFEFIELKGSVTIEEFAAKFGMPRNHAAIWLSKWKGKGYLAQEPPPKKIRFAGEVGRPKGGGYTMGPRWWGELVYGSSTSSM